MKDNKLTFPFIITAMCAIMYFIGFREKREENEKLKQEIEILKVKLENKELCNSKSNN